MFSTNRNLLRYLRDIKEHPLITAEEEIELATRIQQGDMEAMQQLVAANLRFAVSVAKDYRGKGFTMEDLISEANIGLIKAAFRFDPSRGFKFISYAVWWIRQSIMEAISNKGRKVRRPMNVLDVIYKVKNSNQQFYEEHGREPTREELEEITGYSQKILEDAKRGAQRERSLDVNFSESDSRSLKDVIPDNYQSTPESIFDDPSLQHELRQAMKMLDERERDILERYFGIGYRFPMTLGKIGERYGLTRERIRQIKGEALKKLKRKGNVQGLRAYLNQDKK